MKCNICHKVAVTLSSAVIDGQYISERCENCLNNARQGAIYANSYRRRQDLRDNYADTVQPWEEEYAKVYGADAAREKGWSDEQIRKYT